MDLKVISLEEPAFYALINEVVSQVKKQHSITEKKWLATERQWKSLGLRVKLHYRNSVMKARSGSHTVFCNQALVSKLSDDVHVPQRN